MREALAAYCFLLPGFIPFIVFAVLPMIGGFSLSLVEWNLLQPWTFVGLENFRGLLTDGEFWAAMKVSALFTLGVVPTSLVLALLLAVILNSGRKGLVFYRTIYFLPVVTSMVVVSMLWLFLYQPNGLINQALARFGIQGPDWLGDPKTALLAIILMSAWQAMGFHMVIWLSRLPTISADLYEAADLDGAGTWQKFRYVTWPGLQATRTFILITITISAFALFTQVNIMTQGGPLDSTSTLVLMAVRTGFQQQQTGYASAISLAFFVLVLAVTLANRYFTRDKDVVR